MAISAKKRQALEAALISLQAARITPVELYAYELVQRLRVSAQELSQEYDERVTAAQLWDSMQEQNVAPDQEVIAAAITRILR